MNLDTYAQLGYLILLFLMIGGYFFVSARRKAGQTFQHAAVWLLIFIGTVAAVGLWSDIRDDVRPRAAVFDQGQRIEIPRGPDGHYHLTLGLNGTGVDFIIDTGATDLVLSRRDAERIGIDLATVPFTGQADTANGTVRTARTRIDRVELGGITEMAVPAAITDGEMEGSLLGMTYLHRFSKIEISGGKMILTR